MSNIINENCLVCIQMDNNLLKVRFLQFDKNPLFDSPNFLKIINLLDEKNWADIRDVGYEYVSQLKAELPDYFHEEEVLTSPNESYATTFTMGHKTFFEKIPQQTDNDNAKFYIYTNDYNHRYTLSNVIYKLKRTFINYLYKKAILEARKNGFLAFSHRKFGWNTEEFHLDDDFRIKVNTNFGYGRSSYFTLTLYYNEIPIIPHTKVIYYSFVNASSILNYTQDYRVEFESFESCFRFVVTEFNAFKQKGKDSFIFNHIIKSLDELSYLVEKIMDRNIFYFVDTDKIDSYLDLNNRTIIYDYEYLIDNINPKAINEEALCAFLVEYDKLTFNSVEQDSEKTLKMCEELSKNIINRSLMEDFNENFNKERYAYAIAILVSKYSDQNSYWKKLDDDNYNKNIQVIIKKILNIEHNYTILIHKKSGINLMEFRNERIQLIVAMFENLKGLSKLIDSDKYVRNFQKYALLMMEQNDKYLSEIEPLLIIAKFKYLEDSNNYKVAKNRFEDSLLSKQVNYYHELIKTYKNLIETIEFNISNSTFSFGKNFENAFKMFINHLRNSNTIESINFDEAFSINKIDTASFKHWWTSNGNFNDSYEQAFALINKVVHNWYNFLYKFNPNLSNQEHMVLFKEKVDIIATLLLEISKLLKDTFDFKKSFIGFQNTLYNSHQHYSKIIAAYNEAKKPIDDLYKIATNSEREYRKLENNKDIILKFQKQLGDKLVED